MCRKSLTQKATKHQCISKGFSGVHQIFVKPEIRLWTSNFLNPEIRLKPSPVNIKFLYWCTPDFHCWCTPDFDVHQRILYFKLYLNDSTFPQKFISPSALPVISYFPFAYSENLLPKVNSSELQCTANSCSAVHCNSLCCLPCPVLHCTTTQWRAVHCTGLHYTWLFCSKL